MISLVKDILNPINWFKLISEPGKIKIVFDRLFYYPGLNFHKIKPKIFQIFFKKYIISMLNRLAIKNKKLKYFFFTDEIKTEVENIKNTLNFDLRDLVDTNRQYKIFSCLSHNGVAIINNAISNEENEKIKIIFDNIKNKNKIFDEKEIVKLNSHQKSEDVRVLVLNSSLKSLRELRSLSDLISKNVLGKKIDAKAHFMIHQSIKIPEKILNGDNNFHVDRYLPNLKLIYFPYDVDIQSAPFSYSLGSHKINKKYLDFFINNNNNIFDETNSEAKKFLSKKTKIIVKANSLVLALTNGFHGRVPFEKTNDRSALFLTYPDFNLFSLFTYWHINSQNK